MMKATLPYLPPRQARILAVLAKFQELKNTLSMQPARSDAFQAMSTSAPLDDDALLNALKTYGGEKGKQMVENLQQMKDMFSDYAEWQRATQTANSGDKYLSMVSGLETAKKAFDAGEVAGVVVADVVAGDVAGAVSPPDTSSRATYDISRISSNSQNMLYNSVVDSFA